MRGALPADVVQQLDRLLRHIAVLEARPSYEAPLLETIWQAALDGVHLRIVYDSKSRVSERTIYPFGLYASQGFWYCACYDDQRQTNLGLRADRFISGERVEGLERPQHIVLKDWLRVVENDDTHQLTLRARVTARGMKSLDLELLGWPISPAEEGGGRIDATIPASEVDFYATRLLTLGTDLVVESPPELVAAIQQKAAAIAALYQAQAKRQPEG